MEKPLAQATQNASDTLGDRHGDWGICCPGWLLALV